LLQPFSCHRRHQALRVAAALTQVRPDDDIDLVGSLPDPKERSAAAMKSLGIDPAFAPSVFRILDNGKRLECPAGRSLQRRRSLPAISGAGRGLHPAVGAADLAPIGHGVKQLEAHENARMPEIGTPNGRGSMA
jgi:hypothetical protein